MVYLLCHDHGCVCRVNGNARIITLLWKWTRDEEIYAKRFLVWEINLSIGNISVFLVVIRRYLGGIKQLYYVIIFDWNVFFAGNNSSINLNWLRGFDWSSYGFNYKHNSSILWCSFNLLRKLSLFKVDILVTKNKIFQYMLWLMMTKLLILINITYGLVL